jgi:GNAT superfamily N-acetyltransferase
MKTDEKKLNDFGKFLNSQGFDINLADDFWMEDCRFGEHKLRDIFELCQIFASQSLPSKETIVRFLQYSRGYRYVNEHKEDVDKMIDEFFTSKLSTPKETDESIIFKVNGIITKHIDINNETAFILHYKHEYWGFSIFLMEAGGIAFGRVYWYSDDKDTIYLEGLSVDANFRQSGIGNILLNKLEEIGRNSRPSKFICLWVEKDSWMHEWYKRHGYSDLKDHELEKNSIWMRKEL